jgi:hypothetical protein
MWHHSVTVAVWSILGIMAKEEIKNLVRHPPKWRWKRVPSRPDEPYRHRRPQGDLSIAFPGFRNMRLPLQVEVRYVGGPEGECRIEGRGWDFVFPGHVTILEVLQALNGQAPPSA